jgi:methylmalonyl-CoA mutase cobalamin-binding subunit
MLDSLNRKQLFPEASLPRLEEIIDEAHSLGTILGSCAFLDGFDVCCESDYKKQQVANDRIMLHGQIGYRSIAQSQRAFEEIHQRLADAGHQIDRYGICLDWNMGYPAKDRTNYPTGTGLIFEHPEQIQALTAAAPVAPHFGDFVLGMPAALENTLAALQAGATSIGNLGQYFSFRLPNWHDDLKVTAQTVKAIALCVNQPVDILIHSNLDDGFAALFQDLASALGAVLIEQYIVEDLLGGCVSHCYGHTYSEPLARLAFQRALAKVSRQPGTMVYGNTTIYGDDITKNFANLGAYLGVDILAQSTRPSGHAINPVPVTEALRIPSIIEVVEAHLYANQQIQRHSPLQVLQTTESADHLSLKIESAGKTFRDNVLSGLTDAGIDVTNAFEVLLAIRRIGARELELRFAPGQVDDAGVRQRVYPASTITELNQQAKKILATIDSTVVNTIAGQHHRVCLATTDVHEYGKILLEGIFRETDIEVIDGGVCTDADKLIAIARRERATAIAISTYNGIALNYFRTLKQQLDSNGMGHLPVYIGGKLNQLIEDQQNTEELPKDVTEELALLGAMPCTDAKQMIDDLFNRSNTVHR